MMFVTQKSRNQGQDIGAWGCLAVCLLTKEVDDLAPNGIESCFLPSGEKNRRFFRFQTQELKNEGGNSFNEICEEENL